MCVLLDAGKKLEEIRVVGLRKSSVGNFSKNKTTPPRVWLYKCISQHLETAMEPGLFCVFYFP